MFTPVSPTPNEAQAFVQPGSAAAGLLPISVTDAKNFSTPADTEAIAKLILDALNVFAEAAAGRNGAGRPHRRSRRRQPVHRGRAG